MTDRAEARYQMRLRLGELQAHAAWAEAILEFGVTEVAPAERGRAERLLRDILANHRGQISVLRRLLDEPPKSPRRREVLLRRYQKLIDQTEEIRPRVEAMQRELFALYGPPAGSA